MELRQPAPRVVDVFFRLGYNGSLISRVNKSFIFDQPQQAEYMERRCAFLGRFLPQWRRELNLRTALDVGCGVGYFSAFLRDAGFLVTAMDGREENVAQARARRSGIEFRAARGRAHPRGEISRDREIRGIHRRQRKGLAKLFRRLGKGFRRPVPAAAPVTHAGTPRD